MRKRTEINTLDSDINSAPDVKSNPKKYKRQKTEAKDLHARNFTNTSAWNNERDNGEFMRIRLSHTLHSRTIIDSIILYQGVLFVGLAHRKLLHKHAG